MQLYNTLTRKKEVFKPVFDNQVRLYTCGPTVYSYAHIGNLRTYLFEDLLKRALIYNGFKVFHVMNITDVGHLTSDADTGEDKIESAAQKEKKSAFEIAEFYTKIFLEDLEKLNILSPDLIAKATDHIKEDIELIKVLEEKGFTYRTSDGIYFDTSKLKDYGKLTGYDFKTLNKKLKAGARIEFSPEKRNITDFALWKFSPSHQKRQMEWPSPWGVGFPGWHIECAAINLKYLGEAFKDDRLVPEQFKTIDIHTGGIDHIPIHHTNEIAEVEAAVQKKFVNYWLHGEFLVFKDIKMAKSEGNILTLKELEAHGYPPLVYRYFVLGAHYRQKLNFDWPALDSAKNSYANLKDFILNLLAEKEKNRPNEADLSLYQKKFSSAINNDLNTPQALAVLWQLIRQYYRYPQKFNSGQVYKLVLNFDEVLGLKLAEIKLPEVQSEVDKLLALREKLRKERKYQEADEIRKELEKRGYVIEDTAEGPRLKLKE